MPGEVSRSSPGPPAGASLVPPWPEECGMLLGDGTPNRCRALLAGTAGDPRRETAYARARCARCGAETLASQNPPNGHGHQTATAPARAEAGPEFTPSSEG